MVVSEEGMQGSNWKAQHDKGEEGRKGRRHSYSRVWNEGNAETLTRAGCKGKELQKAWEEGMTMTRERWAEERQRPLQEQDTEGTNTEDIAIKQGID